MAQYWRAMDTNGVNYFLEGDTEEGISDAADALVTPANPITSISKADKHDFTLLDLSLINQFKITTYQGWSFYGTASSKVAFIQKWKASRLANTGNFTDQTFFNILPISSTVFQLLQKQVIRMINIHMGQSSADYPESRIPEMVAKCLQGKYNYVRDNYSSSGTSMTPGTGSRFLASKTALNAAGIKVCPTLSLTGATHSGTPSTPRTPLSTNAKWTASATTTDSSAWSKAEIDAEFQIWLTKGINMATLYPDIDFYCIGSEMSNLNTATKILGGTGAKPINDPTFNDATQTWIYSSNSNWSAKYYPIVIAAIAGLIKGIKQVSPNAKCAMNDSSYHYGQCMMWYKEVKRLYNVKMDWFGADWYNTEEYGVDTSGVFTGSSNITRSNRGQCIANAKKRFVDTGLCDGVGIMEMGWNTARSNPDGLNQTTFLVGLMRQQYFADPDCLFHGEYEIFDEPIGRATSTDSAERTYGLTDATLVAMAAAQYDPKPPLINNYLT